MSCLTLPQVGAQDARPRIVNRYAALTGWAEGVRRAEGITGAAGPVAPLRVTGSVQAAFDGEYRQGRGTMTSVGDLARLRKLQRPTESDTAATAAAERLALGRSPQELGAMVAHLQRGTPWDEIAAWVSSARGTMAEAEYLRALELYTDSALLSWAECAGISGALNYRGWPPQNRRDRRPERVVDLVSVEARP